MDDYKVGFTPSQLQGMSETQFSVLFHSTNWEQLNNDTKRSVCQELENRLAAMDNVAPRSVVPEHMQGACYGYQQGDKIAVNVDMLNDGVFRTTYTDEQGNRVTTEHAVQAASWNVYDTIVHEHTHGVNMDRDQAPYTYISSETDHDLYRIQEEERVAYDSGNKATLEAISRAETALGKEDPQKADYIDSINAENYAQCLENAKLAYNDPDIDKTLAQFIANQDWGIVPENRSESYKQLQALYQEQMARELQNAMGWDKTDTVAPQQITNDGKAQELTEGLAATAAPQELTPALTPATEPTQDNDGADLSPVAETVSYGNDGADMGAAAETVSYGNDGADMGAAAETASYGNDGADMGAAAETASYGNDGADMGAAAETASYGNDGADMSADTGGGYDGGNDGGNDGGMSND